jgi:hypothetical protein
MCHAITCRVCGKTTWEGCGQHIEQVRRSVPAGQWCNGRHSAAEIAAATPPRRGLMARLLGG